VCIHVEEEGEEKVVDNVTPYSYSTKSNEIETETTSGSRAARVAHALHVVFHDRSRRSGER